MISSLYILKVPKFSFEFRAFGTNGNINKNAINVLFSTFLRWTSVFILLMLAFIPHDKPFMYVPYIGVYLVINIHPS